MLWKLAKTIAFLALLAFVVSTMAVAAEMTCTKADEKGCTMAKGADGKEMAVMGAGMKMGDDGLYEQRRQDGVYERGDDEEVTLLWRMSILVPHRVGLASATATALSSSGRHDEGNNDADQQSFGAQGVRHYGEDTLSGAAPIPACGIDDGAGRGRRWDGTWLVDVGCRSTDRGKCAGGPQEPL